MKICPKCYSKVPDDAQNCPHCGFKMVKIEPPAPPARSGREEEKKPAPAKKKKAKKSDMIILIGILGAFVFLMVLVTVPMPSLPAPPRIGGGSGKTAVTAQAGGSGGAQSSGGGSGAKQTPKPVATSGTVGAPYAVEHEGTVYFSLRKENIEALLANEDVQTLIDEKELLVLENGTYVTLINVSGEIAFVDVMDGEYEGGVGYVARNVLKPVTE